MAKGSKDGWQPPNLSNVTTNTLINWIAVLRLYKNRINAIEAYLMEGLKNRQKGQLWPVKSDLFEASKTTVIQSRINVKKCRKVLDARTLFLVTVDTEFSTTHFTALKELTPQQELDLLLEALK